MSNILRFSTKLEYRSCIGDMEYNYEDCMYHGKLVNTTDLVTYQAENKIEFYNEFKKAVDDYIAFCNIVGKIARSQWEGQ